MEINRFDNTTRELKGLQDGGQIVFGCIECHTPLLVVQQTSRSSPVITRVVVKCGFCGDGYSCVEQVVGTFYPGAPNDKTVFEPIDTDDGAPEADVLFRAWGK
jgi:hypothetical protein